MCVCVCVLCPYHPLLQDLYVDHDPSPVYQAARAIGKLQALFGIIPKIYGKGKNAKVITANTDIILHDCIMLLC